MAWGSAERVGWGGKSAQRLWLPSGYRVKAVSPIEAKGSGPGPQEGPHRLGPVGPMTALVTICL